MERPPPFSVTQTASITDTIPCGRLHARRDGFLYAGTLADTRTRRNSVVVCVAMTDRPFSIGTRRTAQATLSAALVSPGLMRLDTGGAPVALLDVCPTDYHFRALARVADDVQAWPRPHFADVFDALESFRSGGLPREEAGPLQARFLALALQRVAPAPPPDPRIREVMRLLREEPGLPVASLAAAVDLSVDWLRRLFTTEAGLPLHRYAMTLRLQAAAAHLHRGLSLTQVAANAGFADLAHFSKHWKQHYGFAPRRAFASAELVIDEIPWPCFEMTKPGVEMAAG